MSHFILGNGFANPHWCADYTDHFTLLITQSSVVEKCGFQFLEYTNLIKNKTPCAFD